MNHSSDLISSGNLSKVMNDSFDTIVDENIYDDEIDVVYRGYTFNRGNEDYKIAISPTGFIKCVSEDIPNNLIIDISNSLI